MKIENDLVVSIHFGVAEVDGHALDSTENGAPLEYIQGTHYLVPGLEAELAGKEVGDKFDVTLEAEQAYGPFQEELVQQVPRSLFEGVDEIEVGMSFQAETDQGPRTVEVTEVTEENVSIDANHPLAGMALQFVGEVVGIREATAEELAHGHIHQAGSSCSGHSHKEDHECCGGDKSKHAEGESCCGGHGHEEKKEEKSPEGCCGSCH
ncbi:peptidylprolyl isomerase [Psychromonas ossibalaenae]|uniref:peptidylprolyl isomerase n=1 Tax=Psychromonas ossibalaenae TaxID=444922 RepID=UPI0003771585|nr:peptidylprolyl isomerase [Psychromonas ossibalaenae]